MWNQATLKTKNNCSRTCSIFKILFALYVKCKLRIGLESPLLLNNGFSETAINRRKSSLFLSSPLQKFKTPKFKTPKNPRILRPLILKVSYKRHAERDSGLGRQHYGCCWVVNTFTWMFIHWAEVSFVDHSSQWFPIPWIQNYSLAHLTWTSGLFSKVQFG